jgi:hypothetical protein
LPSKDHFLSRRCSRIGGLDYLCRPKGDILIRTAGVYGGRRKSAKKLCFESGFSFLSDFPAVSGAIRKICSPKNETSFFRWAEALPKPRGQRPYCTTDTEKKKAAAENHGRLFQ